MQVLIITICTLYQHGRFSGSSRYLMFFYDVETTGIRINEDRIIEIGAAVFGEASKYHVTSSTFNQLVYTDIRIPRIGDVQDGRCSEIHNCYFSFNSYRQCLI